MEYYIDSDDSGHKYFIPWSKRFDFNDWLDLEEDDPASWNEPDYAERIEGGTLVFSNPRTAKWNETQDKERE